MTNENLYKLLETTQDQNTLFLYANLNLARCNRYISLNQNCSLGILKILSKSKDALVQYNVAKHHKCSLEILKELSYSKFQFTKDISCKRLKMYQTNNSEN